MHDEDNPAKLSREQIERIKSVPAPFRLEEAEGRTDAIPADLENQAVLDAVGEPTDST